MLAKILNAYLKEQAISYQKFDTKILILLKGLANPYLFWRINVIITKEEIF